MIGLHRHTLESLARVVSAPVLAQRDFVQVSAIARDAIAARIVSQQKLSYFAPIATTPGFAPAVAATMAELRLRGIGPSELSPDLALLLQAYEAEFKAQRLAEAADQFRVAAESDHFLLGKPLLLFDMAAANAAEGALLDRFISNAKEVIEFRLDANRGEGAIASCLSSLQQHLFSDTSAPPREPDESFEIFSASGEALECVEVIREIGKAAEQGIRFDEVAILLRSSEPYHSTLEEAFRRAKVPAWFARGAQVPNVSGRAFLALLHCAAEGCSASAFAEYLSLGQAPTEASMPQGWERILVNAAVIVGRDRWQRRLEGYEQELIATYNAAEAESERAYLRQRLAQLEKLSAFVLPLIERLCELPNSATWGDWLDVLDRLAADYLRKPEAVQALLEELWPMSEIGPVSLEQVILTLKDRLRTSWDEPEASRYGRVFVGSIEDARGMTFKLVFVPGVNEGSFPRTAKGDPLLPEELQPEAEDSVLLRTAAACASERLVLSYSRLELVSGRSRVPSFYAFEALQAAGRSAVNIEFASRSAETRIGWPAPEQARQAIDDAEYDLAFWKTKGRAAWLKEEAPHLVRSLRTRWARWETKWRSYDGMVDLDVEALQVLAKFRLREKAHSASALQQYARCPYRFALRTIYGLRPVDTPSYVHRMDRVTRGILFHRTQSELFQNTGETLDAILDRIASELAEKLAPAIPEVWRTEIEAIRTDLHGLLRMKESDWIPTGSELAFETTILDGIRVKGSIDLIEKHATGMLRVTDYKTGSVPKTIPEHVAAGEGLQPILYALVAGAVKARLHYATLRQNHRTIDIAVNPLAQQRLAQVLQTIDESLHQGWLPAAPRKEGCSGCEYLPICGPYEEERIALKSQPELSTLKKLRSLK